MMIGTAHPSARSCLQTSSPDSFGSMTSSTTRSGGVLRASASPASPSRAATTSYPSNRKPSVSAIAIASSSSTIRTFGISRLQGEPDRERAPAPRLALDRHSAAMRLHDVMHDRKPEPAPLDVVDQAAPHAVEPLENAPLLVLRDPHAVVGDGDREVSPLGPDLDRDALVVPRVLERVVEEIVECLA